MIIKAFKEVPIYFARTKPPRKAPLHSGEYTIHFYYLSDQAVHEIVKEFINECADLDEMRDKLLRMSNVPIVNKMDIRKVTHEEANKIKEEENSKGCTCS
jgi:hypothetical protein